MFFRPKNFHLQWHITEKCNLSCLHCYREEKFLKNELSFFEIKKIFNHFLKLIKEWQLKRDDVRVSFVGGEPFLRKDFFEILELAKQNHSKLRFGILTNGTLIDKNVIKKLKEIEPDYIQISLEGGEKIHDQIRGKGTFKKAIEATKLLKKANIAPFNINFSMTLTKLNLKEIPKVIKIAKIQNVFLAIRRQVPIGFGKKLKKFFLSPLEVKKTWESIFFMEKKFKIKISLGCEDGILVQEFPNYSPRECTSGYLSLTILPNGDVYPCRRLPIFVGNLREKTLKEIYYDSQVLKKLRNLNTINNVCHCCPYFEICHGGARCVAFGFFSQIQAPDPHCWGLFKKLPLPTLKWRIFSKKERLNERLINF